MKIVFKKLNEAAKVPERHDGAFWDLFIPEDITLTKPTGSMGYIEIGTGLSMKIPYDTFAMVLPRSSTFKKTGLLLANSAGIIDPSYCGPNDEWKLLFIYTRDEPFIELKAGDRLAQFTLLKRCNDIEFEEGELLGKDRGGIGSTGR